MSENSLGTDAGSPGSRMPSLPQGPLVSEDHLPSGCQALSPSPFIAPHLTLYPVGLPGGGSQLKWIFRDPAALALGFCGALRSP